MNSSRPNFLHASGNCVSSNQPYDLLAGSWESYCAPVVIIQISDSHVCRVHARHDQLPGVLPETHAHVQKMYRLPSLDGCQDLWVVLMLGDALLQEKEVLHAGVENWLHAAQIESLGLKSAVRFCIR